MTAPNFCMLLRKHIGNGRIVDVYTAWHLSGSSSFGSNIWTSLAICAQKTLVVEIMGKHSNIIFCDAKRTRSSTVSSTCRLQMSSVREVLPGRPYFIPDTMDKAGSSYCCR